MVKDQSKFERSFYPLLVGGLLALSINFNYGYSIAYPNTPVDHFKDFMNRSLSKPGHPMTKSYYNNYWEWILNIANIGFFMGTFINPLLSDRYGRKVGLFVGSVFNFISVALRYVSIWQNSPVLLLITRLTSSACNAIIHPVLILYLQESAPKPLRAPLCFIGDMIYASSCLCCMLLGHDNILGQHLATYSFVPVIPALVSCVFLLFVPETPKYLVLSKKDTKTATRSIRFFQGKNSDTERIIEEIENEGQLAKRANIFVVWKNVFSKEHLRNAVILSVVCLQNTVGMWSIILSSTYFLKEADVSSDIAEWGSTGMMLTYILGATTGTFLIGSYGRRPIVHTFATLNMASIAAFVVFDQLHHRVDFLKYGCVAAFAFYGFTFGCGCGPVSVFINTELTPQQYRSSVQAMTYSLNTVMIIVTSLSILPLYHVIGSYAFIVLYVGPSVFCIMYMYKYLPETKNREINDIINDLKRNKSNTVSSEKSAKSITISA